MNNEIAPVLDILEELKQECKAISKAQVELRTTIAEQLSSHPLKTIFQHKACTNKLYADSFYKVQKNSHSSFEVICCRS